jgi:contact-dependent growth inhibition (CDI) system CdiI-like immunity protein
MATVTYPSRTKPPVEYSVAELRVTISRQLALSRLVPIAIDVLEENPLAEGDCYPGDLLEAVLGVDKQYWRVNRDQWEAVREIVESFRFTEMKLSDPLSAFQTIAV